MDMAVFRTLKGVVNGQWLDIKAVYNETLCAINNLRCCFLKDSIKSRLFISLLWQRSRVTSNKVITGIIDFYESTSIEELLIEVCLFRCKQIHKYHQ
jgi:hypothetical protein